MSSKSGFARYIVYPVVALALMVMALPAGTFAAPAAQGGSRLFPETNQTVSGRFLEVWSQNGAAILLVLAKEQRTAHPESSFSSEGDELWGTDW
jgi:hypothetical protein